MKNIIYDKNSIEFITVGVEYCSLLENANSFNKSEFIRKAVVVLPLLYLKATLIAKDDDEELQGYAEEFVTETEYEMIRSAISSVLGEEDDYLETFHPDMAYSDSPIAAYISEDLADVYQDIKNLAYIYSTRQEDAMRIALADCRNSFYDFWGQKLVNAMGALHSLLAQADQEANDSEDAALLSRDDDSSIGDDFTNNSDFDDEIF
ncbi:MAG: DUF5063 domain-containing protein [Bacteroidales bacterium]